MTITRIRLRRFKRFTDWQADFGPGLTVVRGPNEAGKTTLMEAIFEGLFGNPARGEAVARLRSWGESRLGEITVGMRVGGGCYLLRKDLEAGTILLQREGGGDRVESLREVQRRLLEWIGLATEGAYRATAFVAQGDIARVGEDRRLLSTHLSRILSGAGSEGVQGALRWLAEQRPRLVADLPGGGGASDRASELLERQAALRQREERAQLHRLELREVAQKLEGVEREAAERAELARVARWVTDLHRREQALIEEEAATSEHLKRAEGLLNRLAEIEAGLAEFSSQQEALIAELFQARRQYLLAESGLSDAREQAVREERLLEHLATRHHNTARVSAMGWTLAGSSGILITGGALIAALLQHWIGGVLLASGAGIAIAALRYRGRTTEAGAVYRAQEQRVLELRRRLEMLQRQLAQAGELVADRLRAVGSTEIEEVERRFSSYMDLLREREEIRASLRQIRGSDPRAALEGRLREIAEELSSVRATIGTLPRGARRLPAGGVEQLEREGREAAGVLEDLRVRRARLEGVLEELRHHGGEGPRLTEEVAGLQARAARAAQSAEVIALTARMLEEARSQSVYPARELLERRAGQYLSTATGGAYNRVAIDERTLRTQVWAPSAGDWKEAGDLSQGMSDQLYLCLRLALLDVITEDRRPPVFLDEPFAHLDAERRRAMLTLLVAAAKDRQVVLFTCSPECDAIADRVIVLEPPQASGSGTPPVAGASPSGTGASL
ncbi:MAG: hypothetical protein FJX73_09290 [Armatimonadetes bacterium]|nr:hypothetical protein [Armatimonadota bacterium]